MTDPSLHLPVVGQVESTSTSYMMQVLTRDDTWIDALNVPIQWDEAVFVVNASSTLRIVERVVIDRVVSDVRPVVVPRG